MCTFRYEHLRPYMSLILCGLLIVYQSPYVKALDFIRHPESFRYARNVLEPQLAGVPDLFLNSKSKPSQNLNSTSKPSRPAYRPSRSTLLSHPLHEAARQPYPPESPQQTQTPCHPESETQTTPAGRAANLDSSASRHTAIIAGTLVVLSATMTEDSLYFQVGGRELGSGPSNVLAYYGDG